MRKRCRTVGVCTLLSMFQGCGAPPPQGSPKGQQPPALSVAGMPLPLSLSDLRESRVVELEADDGGAHEFSAHWQSVIWNGLARGDAARFVMVRLLHSPPSGTKLKFHSECGRICDGWAAESTNDQLRGVFWEAPPQVRFTGSWKTNADQPTTVMCMHRESGEGTAAFCSRDTLAVFAGSLEEMAADEQLTGLLERFTVFDWAKPHVGEPLDVGEARYIIESVEMASTVGNRFNRVKSSGEGGFVVVKYTVENLGTSTTTGLASSIRLRDLQGRTFSPSSAATLAAATTERRDVLISEYQPGLPRQQISVFELPIDALVGFTLVLPEKGLLGTDSAELTFSFMSAAQLELIRAAAR